MRKKYLFSFLCLFAGLTMCYGDVLPDGYSIVTDISTLQNGDRVVLYSPTLQGGITGWDGKEDATMAPNGWAEYIVETAIGGVYLKDAAVGKYISNPGSSTTFAYSDTPMLCMLGTGYRFVCNMRYLCQSPISNGYAYRFYTSYLSRNTPFYLYKVPAIAVEAPTFSPAEGALAADGSFTSPFLLTITCATEGAQIYYTLDGTDPSSSESRLLYQSPLSISVTTTLRAIATNGTDNSKEVKVTYLQIKGYAESIAEFIAEAPTSAFELRLTQAQEAVIIGITSVPQHVYLQDKSGKGIILHMQDVNLPENVGLGYQIIGSLRGTLGEYEGKPRIENIQFSEDISFLAGARPKPIVVEAITDATYARYPLVLVSIRDITFNQAGEICKAGNTYKCRDAFGVMSGKTVPESTTLCHITGILGTYGNLSYQIMPVVEADIDTQGALASLPTLSPIGGETPEDAVETERVTITPATNTTVWIDDAQHASKFELPITQSPHALTLTAKRDFYSDNTMTLWYKSPQPSTPTCFSSMDFPEEKPRKTIINNQLVIIHPTGIYNAQGVRMR